jgi:hexulose-6-phosphate isomerase
MQGRLSPMYRNRIQSFPWNNWQNEFKLANELNLSEMEWTIDSYKFLENPILLDSGRKEIMSLVNEFGIRIPSVTCDYFMENPFWKGNKTEVLINLGTIISSMPQFGAHLLVIPLVDNSSISNNENDVLVFFSKLFDSIVENEITIAFELDLNPKSALRFIDRFDSEYFGINYDIGNSASLGFDPGEEIALYGHRILNVHVKDRIVGGTTVPLGEGDADFGKTFNLLNKLNYRGNYILQTARPADGNNFEAIRKYAAFTRAFVGK